VQPDVATNTIAASTSPTHMSKVSGALPSPEVKSINSLTCDFERHSTGCRA
jgi:hypothetical protein